MKCAFRYVLLGCASVICAGSLSAQQVAARDRIPVGKEPAARPAPPPPTVSRMRDSMVAGTSVVRMEEWNLAFPAFEIGAYTDMREPSIAAHLASVDSLQNFLATTGRSKLQNPRAQEFASRMAQDYSANHQAMAEIITDEDVGAAPLAQDPELDRLRMAIRKFEMMPVGPEYDAAFMRFQLDHLQNELELLRRNRGNAHDDDFEELIDEWIEQLEQRRDLAASVAGTLP